MFIDETPMSTLLVQMQKYTNKQMKILHSDVEKENVFVSEKELRELYNKAYRLDDVNALECLCGRYDMERLFSDPDLPKITTEEKNEIFSQIFNMIQYVNPNADIEAIKEKQRSRYQPHKKKKWRDRRYGGQWHNDCFTVKNDEVIFYIRKYLMKLSKDECVSLYRKCYGKQIRCRVTDMTKTGIISVLKDDKEIYPYIWEFMRNKNQRPMVTEDIVDLENNRFKIVTI